MRVSLTTLGLDRLTKKLNSTVRSMPDETDRYVMNFTEQVLLPAVVRHASGRPGPNIVTGAYVAAMRVKKRAQASYAVVNGSPQTHRLEYGFYGTDSIGRVYHQPPFPHFRPALAETRRQFVRGLQRLPIEVWRRS